LDRLKRREIKRSYLLVEKNFVGSLFKEILVKFGAELALHTYAKVKDAYAHMV